ncbi:tryptophan synthase subunit alpha [Pseudanabaena sp. FACHB-1998]|uniref:tryptophan synthase subunit alpha n=1 Tax=Pseudanabaena sp. FACHB-1998 TaxID=2692858 RepID=UPI00168013F8|nr:tryptophan synthase subunit alpha [Pseudanabaena sp. FACHB-1998]MBD2178733.1 tryptophan synthase subunit alpha [Pseudanabaena sp. FACHB-1998]
MISVSARFEELRAKGQAALIPFITAGDPSLETTAKALRVLDQNGADLIELGVPYSDPLADGPVIQAAATRALQNGTTLDKVLDIVREVAPELRSPIILFTYYNPILNIGVEQFLERIYAAGVRGLVVPDLPLEESHVLLEPAEKAGIEVILLIAPTSPPDRVSAIAEKSQGFIYVVSATGVTGVRTEVAKGVKTMIEQLRITTDKPIAVGFGISQPEHAKQVIDWSADGAIVGSAMVKKLAEPEGGLHAIAELCKTLKQAIRRD